MTTFHKEPLRILILEDLPTDAQLAKREVAAMLDPVVFECVETEQDFLNQLDHFKPDLIISDYQMPTFDGLSALKIARDKVPETPFIIHTGSQNEDTAVACMKAGATDYVLKENLFRLGPAVRQALENKHIKQESLRTQEALVESENRFRRLAENADDLIYRYEFLPNRKFAYVSPSATKMTGYTPEEHYADPDLGAKMVHPDDLIIMNKIAERAAKSNKAIVLRWITKNDEVIWTEQKNVAVYNKKGELEAIEGIARNITERKIAETKLQQALKQAEEGDMLKTAFLNNLSHEIRTPLNSILGFTNLLNEPGLSAGRREQFINIINKGGERLLQIINDIISIATIEAGQEKVTEEEVDLKALASLMQQIFDEKAKNKPLELHFQSELNTFDLQIITDKNKLYQIMNNLMTNAIKFTEKGEVICRMAKKQGMLECVISDTGIGIPEKYHELIFERFRQVDSEAIKLHEGSGLGLAISKAFAELMGGSLTVDSSPGKGSAFTVRIPFKKPLGEAIQSEEPTQTRPRQQPKDQKIILVAEDEISNYMLVETLLESLPFKLIHVTNGEDAVTACKENPGIDLVLMDIKMPIMGGLEATRIIKKEKPDLKIIALTAYAQKGDREKALAAGCDDYLAKPIRNQDLLDMVSTQL